MPSSRSFVVVRLLAKFIGIALACLIGLRQVTRFLSSRSTHQDETIPKKLWQTWHTPAIRLEEQEQSRVQSWLDRNPEFQYELITDSAADTFVEHHFSDQLLLKDTYLSLNDTILKADFLRYLIILAEGGVYADIDVECYGPVDEWLPVNMRKKAGAIVGIEADRQPVENDVKLYYDHRKHIWSINNWTFASRRGHSFMRLVAETVARNLQALAKEQGKDLSSIEASYKNVIDTTGPRAFSAAFLEHASRVKGTKIISEDLRGLEEPMMVGDLVVLPIRAMSIAEADRADGNGARSKGWPAVLFHHSVGSWKKTHYAGLAPKSDDVG